MLFYVQMLGYLLYLLLVYRWWKRSGKPRQYLDHTSLECRYVRFIFLENNYINILKWNKTISQIPFCKHFIDK